MPTSERPSSPSRPPSKYTILKRHHPSQSSSRSITDPPVEPPLSTSQQQANPTVETIQQVANSKDRRGIDAAPTSILQKVSQYSSSSFVGQDDVPQGPISSRRSFPTQSQQQQVPASQLLSRPGTTQSPSAHHPGSSTAASTATGTVGGARNSSSNNINTTSLPPPGTNSSGSSLSKIVIAQVFLLVSTMNESNFDEKEQQIRQLCDQHGMEVYSKLVRRLIQGHLTTIFSTNNNPSKLETSTDYRLLQEYVNEAGIKTEKARDLAAVIAESDSDGFKDFDLNGFMRHFELDALQKTIFALGFRGVSKADLRSKAREITSSALGSMLDIVSDDSRHTEWTSTGVAQFLQEYTSDPKLPVNNKTALFSAVRSRFQNIELPSDITAAIDYLRNMTFERAIVTFFLQAGSDSTASAATTRDILDQSRLSNLNEGDVVDMLVMMSSSRDDGWAPENFISAVLDGYLKSGFDWNLVVNDLDQPNFYVKDANTLIALLEGFLKALQKYQDFDIPKLWSGNWSNQATLLSILTALVSTTFARFDIKRIPNHRRVVAEEELEGAPASVKALAATYNSHPLNSQDAVQALLDLAVHSPEDIRKDALTIIERQWPRTPELLLVGAYRKPKPWSNEYNDLVQRLFQAFFTGHSSRQLVFFLLWKFSKSSVVERLNNIYNIDRKNLPLIIEISDELNATLELSRLTRFEFAIDIACFMFRRDQVDLEKWLEGMCAAHEREFVDSILQFVEIKSTTDYDFQGDAMQPRRPESLSPREVSILLTVFEKEDFKHQRGLCSPEAITGVQRKALQSYPRLINLNQGHDDAILSSNRNNFSPDVDARMQAYYQQMYSGQIAIDVVIEELQHMKASDAAEDQDLFACMVHSLFDEYSCYATYPMEPLATTAVLFGSLIEYRLLEGLALKIALGMVLEAVKDNAPEENMFKFGQQALGIFTDRLWEWKTFSGLLTGITGLHGTGIMDAALEAIGEPQEEEPPNGVQDGVNGSPYSGDDSPFLANGNLDESDFPKPFTYKSLSLEAPARADVELMDPSEEVQDKVLFIINNMTAANLEDKMGELQEFFVDSYFGWFAEYLVVQRAKLEPNNHKLYLDFLDKFANPMLNDEVLYESFRNAFYLINADTTAENTMERNHLKHLAGWIGGLTLAKDKPIKHKTIAFKELLLEGYRRNKLKVVLPFTCKVLEKASESKVFMPPNPWTMAIISLMVELYRYGTDLSLNLKFEIEVLCRQLSLGDISEIEASSELQNQPDQEEESVDVVPEGVGGTSLLNFTRDENAHRPERFSERSINLLVPNLTGSIIFSPSIAAFSQIPGMKRIVQEAIDTAIKEIILPVVERSVTIASISTTNMIVKDYAMEPSEEKVMKAAHNMVKEMSGSLALVTCKEPLRMSMSNHIRSALQQANIPDQALPDLAILTFVNDNLELASNIIEQAAQAKSVGEIDENLANQYAQRRQHRAQNPNQPFQDDSMTAFNQRLPDAFRLKPGGLLPAQLAVYDEFARLPRTASDVAAAPRGLQDGLDYPHPGQVDGPSPLPSQQQARLRALQGAHNQRQSLPSPQPAMMRAGQNIADVRNHSLSALRENFADIVGLANETPVDSIRELDPDHALLILADNTVNLVLSSQYRDELAQQFATGIIEKLYSPAQDIGPLLFEILVGMLDRLCTVSQLARAKVSSTLFYGADNRVLDLRILLALQKAGIFENKALDTFLAKMIELGHQRAIEVLDGIMREVVLGQSFGALRADFALSQDKLMHYIHHGPPNEIAEALLQELRKPTAPPPVEEEQSEGLKRDTIMSIFEEWMELYEKPNNSSQMCVTFVHQLSQSGFFDHPESISLFFKYSIELCLDIYAKEIAAAEDPLDSHGYTPVDALAALTMHMVRYQLNQREDPSAPVDKARFLQGLLSVYILEVNAQQEIAKDLFNQKIFFRLFSSLLCEYNKAQREFEYFHEEIMLMFLDTFLILKPIWYPAFAFAWTGLVSHRMFMPKIICFNDREGLNTFLPVVRILYEYLGHLLQIPEVKQYLGKEYYKGLLRITLILFHDFPDFLAEYHYLLCDVLPPACTQLRNLILGAFPSHIMELPNPFTQGLKVDRLDDIKKSPRISGNVAAPLLRRGIITVVDDCLGGNLTSYNVEKILAAVPADSREVAGLSFDEITIDTSLLNALTLYIALDAIKRAESRGEPNFQAKSPHVQLLTRLAQELDPEPRYFFLGSIVNQLRYPNSHTHYFSCTLLILFGHFEQSAGTAVREQITRVLLERLIVHRPHPWGLIITLLELLKNPTYDFWNLGFIKSNPEVMKILFQVRDGWE